MSIQLEVYEALLRSVSRDRFQSDSYTTERCDVSRF
jgi:hypothetical protein